MTTATKSKSKNKVAIPTIGQGKPTNKADLLARFSSKAIPKAKKTGGKVRPVLTLTKELEEQFRNYGPVKELYDVIEARNSREKSDLNSSLFDLWIDKFWETKSVPTNPSVEGRDESGNIDTTGLFQVQNKFKVAQVSSNDEDETAEDVFLQMLVDLGLGVDEAATIVAEELCFIPRWNLAFTELIAGQDRTQDEEDGASVLFLAIQDLESDEPIHLSKEQKEALNNHINSTAKVGVELVDKAGFLSRCCNYCNTKDQLIGLLSVITPVFYIKNVKCGVGKSLPEKNNELIVAAASILGCELGVDSK